MEDPYRERQRQCRMTDRPRLEPPNVTTREEPPVEPAARAGLSGRRGRHTAATSRIRQTVSPNTRGLLLRASPGGPVVERPREVAVEPHVAPELRVDRAADVGVSCARPRTFSIENHDGNMQDDVQMTLTSTAHSGRGRRHHFHTPCVFCVENHACNPHAARGDDGTADGWADPRGRRASQSVLSAARSQPASPT